MMMLEHGVEEMIGHRARSRGPDDEEVVES